VTSSVANECYFSITVQINVYRLEKKSVMDRRGNIYTEVSEDLVTGCCKKKGKKRQPTAKTHHLINKLFN
jgi:hypothetical protein